MAENTDIHLLVPNTIYLMQRNTSSSHQHAVDPEHPEIGQWVTCLMNMQALEELGHFQLQELCTDPWDMDCVET
jgi:hypothetical protein